jgi:hypothetical protein
MSDLLKQAEALEVRACDHESAAKNLTVSAERCRAQAAKLRELDDANRCKEAAKLREQARNPRIWWICLDSHGGTLNAFGTEADAIECADIHPKTPPPIRAVEVRPVRITDEHIFGAVNIWNDTYTYPDGFRAVMTYALSLAGVEVEK